MQSSVQTGGRSASPLNRSKSNSEHPPSPAYSASGRPKKRERSDKSVDSSKRKRSSETPELSSLIDKDGGLLNVSAVDRLFILMQQDLNKSSRKLKEVALRRTSLAAVIGSTVRDDCLKKFVQLGGLALLNDWLQDAHNKGKHGDGGISDDGGDRTLDDLILTLLQALEKLPVDLDALKTCNAGKSVKNLRSHSNTKIHRKAKKLVEAWKKRVDAEMKQSEEAKTGSKQELCRPFKPVMPKDSPNILKNGGPLDGNVKISGGFGSVVKNTTANNSSSMGEAAISLKKGGTTISNSGGASAKESPCRMQFSNSPPAEIDGAASVPDERSSNSNQPLSNGLVWATGPVKNAVSNWKEDSKGSVSNGGNTKAGNSRSHMSSKGSNPASKEAGLGKPLARSTSAGLDKKSIMQVACDKTSNELTKVEACGNNQRLILRLPNTARSSISSSFADAAVPSSKDSSSNVAERSLDFKDRKSRLQNASMENASIKNVASRHDDIEKLVDMPKRRNEMECHSSESYVSFSSTECCTLEFKKNHQHQESQQVNDMTYAPSKHNSVKSNGYGAGDINAGISLLASIAADENLRMETNAAIAAFEEQRNAKDSEIQQQGARTTCLTDSENSPLSGITETSGRIEAAPDPDVKDAQGNCEYLKSGSDGGVPNAGSFAGAIDTDLGQSDENIKTSEGISSDPKPCEGKVEGISCLPMNDGKSSDLQSMRPRSPSGRSSDDNINNENVVALDTAKDSSPLEDIVIEDKKTPSPVDISSACLGKFEKSIEEICEKKSGSSDSTRESAYNIPGEDAIEVAMQVAKEATMEVPKEVKEEIESYGNVSLERDNKLETNFEHKKTEPSTDHPVSDKHSLEFSDQKDNEKGNAGDHKTFEENLHHMGDEETEQTSAHPSFVGTRQSTLGIERLDERPEDSSALNESDKSMHSDQLQNSFSMAAGEPKETAKAELSTSVEVPGKFGFDLNEGIHLEESPHETNAAISYPIASIPITPVAFHPVASTSLSGIIPPVSALQGKPQLGWKGTAATSAFRRAEPRKTPERCQNATESTTTNVLSASVSPPARPFLDFDLNIADEEPIEEGRNPISQPAQNSSGSRLDLDLNRIDESEESGAVLASEIVSNEGHISAGRSKTIEHDFDLNAGVIDDTASADPVDPRRNQWNPGYASSPAAGFKMSSEIVNLHPWNPLGSTFSSPPIPPVAQVRQDASFSASMPPAYFNLGQGQGIPQFHSEICRPPAELSPSASSLPYPIPSAPAFQYGGFQPLGFTSASFPASASFLDSSGSSLYAPMAPPFLTSGAIHPSPSRPPYLTGFPEIGATVTSNSIWPRPSLDLNAGPSLDLNSGPEHADTDAREDRTAMRQASVFHSPFSREPQIRVLRQSVEPSDYQKRKEPEVAWDLYRPDAGPELTDVDARDERVTLRQSQVFGSRFFSEDQIRSFRQPETAESLKRREPEGGWDVHRGSTKQALWR